jgi:hypothetical protein
MARTELTVVEMTDVTNSNNGEAFVGTAGIADGHKFVSTGKEWVLITKASADGIVTFPAFAKAKRQTISDKAVTVATASTMTVISDFPPSIFRQADGMVYINYAAGVESQFSIQVFRRT